MPASGRSDNRLSEFNRGYHGTGGHGIYADTGRRARELELAGRTAPPPARRPRRSGSARLSRQVMSWLTRAPRTKPVVTDLHPTRLRATIERTADIDMYGRESYFVDVHVNPTGTSLCSMLTDGRHAPVLDVDHPVTLAEHTHGTAVTITTDLDPDKVSKALYDPIAQGLVHPDTLDLLTGAAPARRWWRRRKGWVANVIVVFPFPVVAVGSKSPGHFHLLVQQAMEWLEALTLMKGLADAGVVDPRYARITGRGDFMYVDTPPSEHDTI